MRCVMGFEIDPSELDVQTKQLKTRRASLQAFPSDLVFEMVSRVNKHLIATTNITTDN
jgi:hypothetical protein